MLSYLLTIVYFQIPILNRKPDNDDYFFQYSNGYYSMKNRLCRRNGLSVNNYQNNSTFSSLLHFHKQLFYPLVSDFIISLSLYWNINHPAYWSIRRFGFRDFPNIIMNNSITVLIKLSFVAIYTTSNRDLLNMEGRQHR